MSGNTFSIGSCTLVLFVLYGGFLSSQGVQAQSLRDGTLFTGAVINLPTRLQISQRGSPDIQWTARFRTRPWKAPFYYALKIGLQMLSGEWEIQFLHHKLYLTRLPKAVQHFEITHGFNVLSVHKRFFIQRMTLIAGGGMVLPHSASEIRRRKYASTGGILNTGYRVTGPAIILGAGLQFPLRKKLHLSLELQLLGARATVPVYDGKAQLLHGSIHLLLGLRYVRYHPARCKPALFEHP